jgi:hypothetical protein
MTDLTRPQTTRPQTTRPQTARPRWRRLRILGPLVVALVAIAAACGDDDTGASANGARSVTVTSPTASSPVGTSFAVTVAPTFDIGPPDTGRPHIHLHFDGSPEYEIAYETTHDVSGLAPGMHSVVAVVANPDHSETDHRSPTVTFEVSADGAGSQPGATVEPTPTTAGGISGY